MPKQVNINKVYRQVKIFYRLKGLPPTIRETALRTKLSKQTVHSCLLALVACGKLIKRGHRYMLPISFKSRGKTYIVVRLYNNNEGNE